MTLQFFVQCLRECGLRRVDTRPVEHAGRAMSATSNAALCRSTLANHAPFQKTCSAFTSSNSAATVLKHLSVFGDWFVGKHVMAARRNNKMGNDHSHQSTTTVRNCKNSETLCAQLHMCTIANWCDPFANGDCCEPSKTCMTHII